MPGTFDYFVLFAEMRTGSNFLETNLNSIDGLVCHGEAFNPHFIGYPNKTELLGVTQSMRDAEPGQLIERIKTEPEVLAGFRFFHDHDPRVLDTALDDPRCGKIILTRNPLESYVSWKIARTTGQWKLTDVKRRKDAKAVFDGQEFLSHVQTMQSFQVKLLNRMQISGQTAFYIAYEDLQNVEVLNGLAKWLGVEGRLDELDKSLKRQNPSPVTTKVSNGAEMERVLAELDRFDLTRTPNFEPRRGPAVPSYVAGSSAPLLYMPIQGGPDPEVRKWLADIDGVTVDELPTSFNQKQLRQWKRKHPGHRSFTVLRHPAARAHSVFCSRILSNGPGSLARIRETLRKQFNLDIPKGDVDESYTLIRHRKAFETFLEFVRANNAGQTAIRIDPAWCTQSGVVRSFADFALPDMILREDELPDGLSRLAEYSGYYESASIQKPPEDFPFGLSRIYDEQLESLVYDVYQRDYMMFGFGPWKSD